MTEKRQGRGASYRKAARARVETFDVELPSGAVFLLRKPDLELFTLSGVLPVTVTAKMHAAQRAGQTADQAFADLAIDEQIKAVEFGRKMLEFICVDPRIVADPVADDEIGFEDLDPADLRFLTEWANTGGGDTAEAESFRNGGRQASVAGAHRKK